MEAKLTRRFENILQDCVKLSIKNEKIYFLKLFVYLKGIRENKYFFSILSKYYVHVFRPADKEFKQLILENDFEITCASISKDIILRKIKDEQCGEFSF